MLQTVIRTCILYIIIILAMRLMGKRQIGDLQPSELVITILISEIAAIPIQDLNIPIIYGILATFTLVFLEILTSLITMKSINMRKLLYGSSSVIIKDGVIDQKMLRRLRLTIPDLMEVLRNQEIFDLEQVGYAILETNGQMSVLLKAEYQTASVNDLKGIRQSSAMPCLIISDGKFMSKAMRSLDLTKSQIKDRLSAEKIQLKDVFIMTRDKDGNETIVLKQKQQRN